MMEDTKEEKASWRGKSSFFSSDESDHKSTTEDVARVVSGIEELKNKIARVLQVKSQFISGKDMPGKQEEIMDCNEGMKYLVDIIQTISETPNLSKNNQLTEKVTPQVENDNASSFGMS